MSLQSWWVFDQDWSDCWTQAMLLTHCFVTRRYVGNEPKAKQLLHGNECWLRRWSYLPPVCQHSLVGRVFDFDNPVLWHMYLVGGVFDNPVTYVLGWTYVHVDGIGYHALGHMYMLTVLDIMHLLTFPPWMYIHVSSCLIWQSFRFPSMKICQKMSRLDPGTAQVKTSNHIVWCSYQWLSQVQLLGWS